MTNGSSLFVNALGDRTATPSAGALIASVAACALLSGCIHPYSKAEIDPRSPVAAEVASTVRPGAPFPLFVNFPKVPTDVRPHLQYGKQAAQTGLEGVALEAGTADSTWTLSGTDAFAAQVLADAGPELPPPDPADTLAFVKEQRARATPPPPVKR